MAENAGFGAGVARLLGHRGPDTREPADRAGPAVDEAGAVLAGEEAGEAVLRRLAPRRWGSTPSVCSSSRVVVVPDDRAPLDAAAGQWIARLVTDGVHLPPAGRQELLRYIRPPSRRRSAVRPSPLRGPQPSPTVRVVG